MIASERPFPEVGSGASDSAVCASVDAAGYREEGTFAFRSSSQFWMRFTCVTGE